MILPSRGVIYVNDLFGKVHEMATMQSIGEKAFIRDLLPLLKTAPTFVNGFGHDASIMDVGLEKNIAFKIDRAPYPLALKNGWANHKAWGHLAVVANLSDLLSIGATPSGFMVSIVVPSDYDSSDVKDIVIGCAESCEAHKVVFLGGDTKEGPTPQVIGSAFGTIERGQDLGRRQAKAGDKLVIAGQLGGLLGAYLHLKRAPSIEEQSARYIEHISNPTARLREATRIARSGLAIASCDLSDGLSDAISIFCGSSVGIALNEAAFPLHELALEAASNHNIPSRNFAFSVGDWAIAYVVPHENYEKFLEVMWTEMHVTCIGQFTDSTSRIIRLSDGGEAQVPNVVNEHFSSRLEDEGSYLTKIGGETSTS